MSLWHRLGVSAALVTTFYATITKAFRDKAYYENYRWHICVGLIGVGIALWLVGRISNGRHPSPAADSEDADNPEDIAESSEPFFLANPGYWGVMLVVFGLIVTIIGPTRSAGPQPVAARTNSIPAATKVPINISPQIPAQSRAQSSTNQSARFPTFKLQGVVYRQPNPSVLINGKTFFVGESVEGAKIMAIDPHSATFEWEGQPITVRTPN